MPAQNLDIDGFLKEISLEGIFTYIAVHLVIAIGNIMPTNANTVKRNVKETCNAIVLMVGKAFIVHGIYFRWYLF